MGIDGIIAERTPFEQMQRQQQQRQATNVGETEVARGLNLNPWLSAEKSNVMLWLSVAQTLLLLYIAWKL